MGVQNHIPSNRCNWVYPFVPTPLQNHVPSNCCYWVMGFLDLITHRFTSHYSKFTLPSCTGPSECTWGCNPLSFRPRYERHAYDPPLYVRHYTITGKPPGRKYRYFRLRKKCVKVPADRVRVGSEPESTLFRHNAEKLCVNSV